MCTTRDVSGLTMGLFKAPLLAKLPRQPPEHAGPGFNRLPSSNALLDPYPIRTRIPWCGAATTPLARLQPAVACADVTLQVRNPSVVALVVSSDNWGPERRWPADRSCHIFRPEVAGGDRTTGAGRGNPPPRFGGGSGGGREGCAGGGICLHPDLVPLLVP